MKLKIRGVVALAVLIIAGADAAVAQRSGRTARPAGQAERPVRPDTVHLLPRWKMGQKMLFEVVKGRTKIQNDKVTLRSSTRTDLEIEVIEATRKGFAVKWTFDETKFDDPKQAEQMPLSMRSVMKGAVMILEVDAEGTITAIRNLSELMAEQARVIELMIKEMEAAGETKEVIDAVRRTMASFKREHLVELMTTEANLLYLPLGQVFTGSEPVRYETEIANVFGGRPFPAKGFFELKGVDKNLGRATVGWGQYIDQEKARANLEQTLRELAMQMGRPLPEGKLFGSIFMDDSAEVSVDIATGWTEVADYSRHVEVKAGEGAEAVVSIQRDTTQITRRPPKAASPRKRRSR